MFKSDASMSTVAGALKNAAGMKTLEARDFKGAALESALDEGNAIYFERFKMCVVDPKEGMSQLAMLSALESVQQARPEFYMFAISEAERRYNEWVRAGLMLLADGAPSMGAQALPVRAAEMTVAGTPIADTNEFTWGLIAVGAIRSSLTGRGVKVAVLDTGIDLQHPDFVGRSIVTESFIPSETVQDKQGHGTHTAGTVAGPATSTMGRRYGVAPDVDLHVGKVLNNQGTGREAEIINGINWAIDKKCAVISMSLGRPTAVGEKPDPFYEEVGAVALREGSIIVAAAGNNSFRDFNHIAPVGAPANSPSIFAVAAIDPKMGVAPFSCGGLNPDGGEVNISGPGTLVYSSVPRPELSKVLQGTSMACPHVAGVAALWVQSDPALRGQALWNKLERTARELGIRRDFGRGLVQAPGMGPTS